MSNTLSIENYVPLTYETKIIRPGRFFVEKLKLSENDPCTENEHTRVDIFFHLTSHYIFLFMDCTAISDMTVYPFLTPRDAETSVL